MKKIILQVCAVLSLAAVAAAGTFSDYEDYLRKDSMSSFAADLGGLIGSADFHSGSTVGFPGLDISLMVNGQFKPSPENQILNDADINAFGIPMLSVAVGLPMNFEAVARGSGMSGVILIGGGLRYSIAEHTLLKFLPEISAGVFYDNLNQDYFKLQHFSMSLSAGFNLPIIKPYVGMGWDNTKIQTKIAAGGVSPVDVGYSTSASEMRYTAGVNLTISPLVKMFAAYNLLHGESGAQVGFSAGF